MNEDTFQLGVKALIMNAEQKILLLKVNVEKLTGYSGVAYWDIPGGRIHRNSSVEETLKREVEEETGIKVIENIKPFAMVLSNIRIPVGSSDCGLVLASYICTIREPISVRLSEEHTEYDWVTVSKAAELLSYKYPQVFIDQLLSDRIN
jgi:8-oxo-dGTP pyrophosphatase MutT (NUDIX family)